MNHDSVNVWSQSHRTLCLYYYIWLNKSISEWVKVCAWQWAPLPAQPQGLPGHCPCRHFTEHRAPKGHKPAVPQQCHHFPNLWGGHELLIESFQELQVPFIHTVPTPPQTEWVGSMCPKLQLHQIFPCLLPGSWSGLWWLLLTVISGTAGSLSVQRK